MNDCVNVEVRDALPDFLNGRLGELDNATMKAHIESCPDCRAELSLLREARATSLLAPLLDVNRIAHAIPAYGGVAALTPEARRAPVVSSLMWKFAAAAIIVIAGGWLVSQRGNSAVEQPRVATESAPARETASEPAAPSPAVVAVPDARSTPIGSRESGAEIQVASLSLVGSTTDISDLDLEQLVRDLDAIDALPAAEPTAVTLTVEDIESTNEQ